MTIDVMNDSDNTGSSFEMVGLYLMNIKNIYIQ